MSIELNDPKTLLGKVDAAANYVAQIRLAAMIGDKDRVMHAVEQAERLLFNATNALGELPGDWHTDSALETWFPLSAEKLTSQQDALDMDRDEFARIAVIATSAEVQGICARAMQRIERATPLIREHEELRKDYVALAASALNARECVRELLHSLRNPKFMAHAERRAKELLATEFPTAGRAAAEGSADETGESKSGAGSASDGIQRQEPRQ